VASYEGELIVSLYVRLRGKYGKIEKIALKVAEALFEKFPGVMGLESVDSWDGANLRIIVSRDDPDLIDRLMERVFEIIDKYGEIGNIVPEIVRFDELMLRGEPKTKVHATLVNKLKEFLRREFDCVIDVVPVDSWDGANLRIIVSRDDPDLIDRLMERVFEIIDEHGEIGNIVPEIVKA